MYTLIYTGYKPTEINDHWIKEKVPGMLAKLSVESFSLNNLEKLLRRESDKDLAMASTEVIQKTRKDINYLLFCFNKLSVMVA